MFRLALVSVLISCGGSPAPQRPADPAPAPSPRPAAPVPAPAPIDAAVAQVSPDAAPPAPPPVLSTELAIVYADKLGIVRAGSPIDAEPQLVALPDKLFRPPVWSGSGDIFLGLAHGEVARVDASGVHPVVPPKGVHRTWEPDDELYAAKDGSVWLHQCTTRGKHTADCAKWQFARVDVPGGKPAAKGPAARARIPWPKVAPPSGHTVRNVGQNGMPHLVCEAGPPGSAYKMPAGEVELPALLSDMMWVSHQPPLLAVHLLRVRYDIVEEPPGSRGGTTETEMVPVGTFDELFTDCDYKTGRPTRVVAAPDGLYAFRDADSWKLARDGVVLRELPGALDVAFAP